MKYFHLKKKNAKNWILKILSLMLGLHGTQTNSMDLDHKSYGIIDSFVSWIFLPSHQRTQNNNNYIIKPYNLDFREYFDRPKTN